MVSRPGNFRVARRNPPVHLPFTALSTTTTCSKGNFQRQLPFHQLSPSVSHSVIMATAMNALERFTDNNNLRKRRMEEDHAIKVRMAAEEARLRLLGLTLSPMAGLPAEIVLLIFEFAAFASLDACLMLCLVCSSAWKIATPILYESIWLGCIRLRNLSREFPNRRKNGDPLQHTKALVLLPSTIQSFGEMIFMEQPARRRLESETHFLRDITVMSDILSVMENLVTVSLVPSTFRMLFPLFWAPRAPFSTSMRPFPKVTILEQQVTSREYGQFLAPETMVMQIGHCRNSVTRLEVQPAYAARIFEGPFGSGLLQAFPLLTHIAWVGNTGWPGTRLPNPVTLLTPASAIIPDYPLSIFGPVVKPLPEQIQFAVFRILVPTTHSQDKLMVSDTCESHVAQHAVPSWGKLGGRWIILVEDEMSPLEPLINGVDMWTRAKRLRAAVYCTV